MTADLASRVLAAARARKIRLAVAESCTGGLLSGAITDIAGSSAVFECGYVTYSNAAKQRMLGVRASTLDEFGAVSEQIACEMADGVLKNCAADLAISITGIAGPGGSDHKPEGRVCFALASRVATTRSETCEFGALGRHRLRMTAVQHGLTLLLAALERVEIQPLD